MGSFEGCEILMKEEEKTRETKSIRSIRRVVGDSDVCFGSL